MRTSTNKNALQHIKVFHCHDWFNLFHLYTRPGFGHFMYKSMSLRFHLCDSFSLLHKRFFLESLRWYHMTYNCAPPMAVSILFSYPISSGPAGLDNFILKARNKTALHKFALRSRFWPREPHRKPHVERFYHTC
jgi:hypothetical protein